MIYKEFTMNEEGSLEGSKLTVYIQDTGSEKMKVKKRPLVLLCPGGAYSYTSDREAEPVAMAFMAMGFHTAILRYSCFPAHYPTSLFELGRSVLIIREHAKEWRVDDSAIIVQGCSAGGHLAASFACFWKEDLLAKTLLGETGDAAREKLRPNGLLLCYPVITSGEHAHKDSFKNLLGERLSELEGKMSLETAVNSSVPRTFMWHTFTDGAVPVENSLLFATALRAKGINTELHIFPEGCHGLALANRLTESTQDKENVPVCQPWITLAGNWLDFYWNSMETS